MFFGFVCCEISYVMRKHAFCICEYKGKEDQLHGNCTADQHLRFCYIDSTISLLPKSEISSLEPLSGCTARFVLDLVGNQEDRFSHDEAQILVMY